MKRITKLLSLILSFVMLLCFLPHSVLAQIGEVFASEETAALTELSAAEDAGSADTADVYVLGEVTDKRTETGETALKRVAQTFRNKTNELVTVKAGDEVIEATPEHPFYVPGCDKPRGNSTGLGKGWVKAKDLRQGDVLVLFDGSTITVDSVTTRTLFKPITVYNFEVEDFHTYFVGHYGFLVHNDCGTSRPPVSGTPGSIYTQYSNDGSIVSVATYGGNGLVATRVDFTHSHYIKSLGRSICPHVHCYTYNASGQPCGHTVQPY